MKTTHSDQRKDAKTPRKAGTHRRSILLHFFATLRLCVVLCLCLALPSLSVQAAVTPTFDTINGLTITSGTNTFTITKGTATVTINSAIGTLGSAASVTLGTGVGTALAINVGSAGAFTTFNGAHGTPSSLTLTNATGLPVAGGGTGVATLTAYAPLFGGTTSTGALQSGTVGTAGQVLTSNGAGTLATFQAAASSGLTIGTTTVSGASANDLLISNGTVVQKIIPGTGVAMGLATAVNSGSGFLTATQASFSYQPLNLKLSSISALANAAGFLRNDGSGVFSYSYDIGVATATSINGNTVTTAVQAGTSSVAFGSTFNGSSATANTGFGASAMYALTSGSYNTALGAYVGPALTTGEGNTLLGASAGGSLSTGNDNTVIGTYALVSGGTGSRNVAIGYTAGAYETGSDSLYIDNQDRTNTAGDKAKALIYGTFAGTAAGQQLTINAGTFTISGTNVVTLKDYALTANASGTVLISGGALGTPASGSGANLTALTAANITASTTAGRAVLNVTNPSAISFLKIAADNTVSTRTPAQVLSDIGADNASNLASGTLPDARFPAALPALSGVNLTALTAANITASTTVGRALLNLTNPSAVTWNRVNADNTVSSRTAAQTLSDIGAQASGSYAASGANSDIISLSGVTAITGGAGNMTITSGTGNSRTLIFKTTTGGGTATTALTLGADQSAAFAGFQTWSAGSDVHVVRATNFRIRDSSSARMDILNAAGSDWGGFAAGSCNLGQGSGGAVIINSTTESTSTSTGGLTLTGGFGLLKNLNVGGNTTLTGALIGTPEAVAPALNAGAAVSVATTSSGLAVNGVNALTLANGTHGQIKTIACTAVTAAGTATLTPTTANGFSTVAFTAAGQSVTLQYFTTGGWVILSVRGATIAANLGTDDGRRFATAAREDLALAA